MLAWTGAMIGTIAAHTLARSIGKGALRRLLGRLLRRLLGGTVPGIASQHPPAEPDHAQPRDQEGDAEPEPSRHPLAGKKDHSCSFH